MNDVIADPLHIGEIRPIYGSATPASGTLTISGQATYTIYDPSGAVVGVADSNVTENDAGAVSVLRVWKTVDTTGWSVGNYRIVFKFSATSSVDGITRKYEPSVLIPVRS